VFQCFVGNDEGQDTLIFGLFFWFHLYAWGRGWWRGDARPPVLWNREPPLTTHPRSQVGTPGMAWV